MTNEYILPRKAGGANPDNTLQISDLANICCGDANQAAVCRWALTIDVTSVTSASQISLGGILYQFGKTIVTNTAAGRVELKKAIEDVISTAGYIDAGVTFSLTGNNLTITSAYSMLTFDYLQAAANKFYCNGSQAIGQAIGDCCADSAIYVVPTKQVKIQASSCASMTNLKINDGASDLYDGLPGTDAPAGNVTYDATTKTFNIDGDVAGENYAGATTFTITVSSTGCSDIVVTQSYTF